MQEIYVSMEYDYVYMQKKNDVDMQVTNLFRWSDLYVGKMTY